MLALAFWWPQLAFERALITVVPELTFEQALVLMLFAGAAPPPPPPGPPGAPAPPVGLSWATAMPPAVAATAAAPKAATIALRVFMFLAFPFVFRFTGAMEAGGCRPPISSTRSG